MIQMWENAAFIDFLGVRVYAFGLYCALGTALGLIALALLLRNRQWKKGTAPLTGVLAMLCGFALSRLLFGGLDSSLGVQLPLYGMLMITGGGYSMIGALLGACLGAVLSARVTRQSPARLLDFLAPALMLFAAFERLGEGYIEDFGISRPLVYDFFKHTFLAVEGPYAWYLATYMLESLAALILAVLLLRDESQRRRPGDTFLLFLMLFGATQVVLESLRNDEHMRWSYVNLQQVFAFLTLSAGVVCQAARQWSKRHRLAIAALASVLMALLAGVALELIIYRTEISRYLLYAVFAAVMAVPVWLGVLLRREEKV